MLLLTVYAKNGIGFNYPHISVLISRIYTIFSFNYSISQQKTLFQNSDYYKTMRLRYGASKPIIGDGRDNSSLWKKFFVVN